MPIYFFSFLFMIKKFNLQTPGRGGRLISKEEYRSSKGETKGEAHFDTQLVRAYHLVDAYGGAENIETTDACITKLRVTVKDPSKIDTNKLKQQGSSGSINVYDKYVVAIFGTESDNLRTLMLKVIKQQVDLEKLREFVAANKSLEEVKEEESKSSEPCCSNFTTTLALGESLKVISPVAGKVVTLEKLEDESFLLLGRGVAIEPKGTAFKAPLESGILEVVFPTKHAYIFSEANLKVMVHVGIDSIKLLQGEGGSQESIDRTFKLKTGVGSSITKETFLNVT